jgi:predicted methyltransferase
MAFRPHAARATVALLAGLLLAGCGSARSCAYESGRDAWQQPAAIIAALDIAPGDQVADLGSGSGYFTRRLAEAVGPEGRVYAVYVDPEIHAVLEERLEEEGVTNVEIVLAEFDDPLLPAGTIDLVFTSNTYHHIEDRVAYFRRVHAALTPDGRVAVLDYDGSKGLFVKTVGHYTPPDVLFTEMAEAGYEVAEQPEISDRQSFVIFRIAGGD